MLFSSLSFILIFLPLSFLLLIVSSFISKYKSVYALIFVSFVFYACWNGYILPVLIISILLNFIIAKIIMDGRSRSSDRAAHFVLFFGICGNLSALFYYKYSYFFLSSVGAVFGANFGAEEVILPLGISFFTFQQIGYLVSAGRGNLVKHDFKEYVLFVSFFPQLIAGPIILQQEFFPQIRRSSFLSFRSMDLAIGLTIFAVGLFKKTVIADGLDVYTSPFYASVASGDGISHV